MLRVEIYINDYFSWSLNSWTWRDFTCFTFTQVSLLIDPKILLKNLVLVELEKPLNILFLQYKWLEDHVQRKTSKLNYQHLWMTKLQLCEYIYDHDVSHLIVKKTNGMVIFLWLSMLWMNYPQKQRNLLWCLFASYS